MNVNKYQITLNSTETAMLALNSLGLNVPEYIKFLARQDAMKIAGNIPVMPASKKLEGISNKALNEYKAGKTKLLYEI